MGADPSLVLNYWGFLPPTLTFTRSVATDASGSTSRLRAASLSAAPAGDHKKYPQLRGAYQGWGKSFPPAGRGAVPHMAMCHFQTDLLPGEIRACHFLRGGVREFLCGVSRSENNF